jgi:hypothetical protein
MANTAVSMIIKQITAETLRRLITFVFMILTRASVEMLLLETSSK